MMFLRSVEPLKMLIEFNKHSNKACKKIILIGIPWHKFQVQSQTVLLLPTKLAAYSAAWILVVIFSCDKVESTTRCNNLETRFFRFKLLSRCILYNYDELWFDLRVEIQIGSMIDNPLTRIENHVEVYHHRIKQKYVG